MAIQNDPVHIELLAYIENSERDIKNCDNPDYLPQERRKHVWDLADMGDYLRTQDMNVEALAYYRQAMKIDCDEPSVLNQVGVCLIQIQKVERALFYFELMSRRVDSDTDKALAWYNISVCHQLLNNFNEAVVALRKSLKFEHCDETARQLAMLKAQHAQEEFMNFAGTIFGSRGSMTGQRKRNEEEELSDRTKVSI
ncbi:MAG: hypothetical protein NXI01_09775 [Gammaproteobacteria bacterium]|nr:hypothetical protein [Gammaproteobacteria bacterium]